MKQLEGIGKCLVFILLIGLSACYESKDGCIDILSSNYDVAADTQCEDCCEYPSLVLNLKQENNGEEFRLGDTITNNLNIQTRVLKLVYLVSNISITLDQEQTFVDDSVLVSEALDTFWLRDDFARISRTKARYNIGGLRDRGFISQLQFDVGLSSVVDGVDFVEDIRNDLNTDPDSLRMSDNTYIVQRLLLGVGADLTDSITVDVPASVGKESVTILLDTSFVAGKDKEMNLTVDYGSWFDDIDFEDADQSETSATLMENLARCFR